MKPRIIDSTAEQTPRRPPARRPPVWWWHRWHGATAPRTIIRPVWLSWLRATMLLAPSIPPSYRYQQRLLQRYREQRPRPCSRRGPSFALTCPRLPSTHSHGADEAEKVLIISAVNRNFAPQVQTHHRGTWNWISLPRSYSTSAFPDQIW